MFAGLWEVWKRPEDDEWMHSCTIVTVASNEDMADIHDRMPLVLEHDVWDRWLDPELQDREELEAMLHSGPEGTIEHYAVGKRVGPIKNDDAELIKSL